MTGLQDGLRLAIGTLTRVPVPPPSQMSRSAIRTGMLLAPAVGLVIAAIAALPMLLTDLQPILGALGAAATVLLLAWLNRALHLDGLADTADALGSRAPAERALAIARQPDIGPFGVVAVVAALALQIIALSTITLTQPGIPAYVIAALALGSARAAVTLGCTRWFPAARPDGLGAAVAGSVPRAAALATWIFLISLAWLCSGPALVLGLLAACLSTVWVLLEARRRFGGMTGDVLGSAVEVAATASLVVACVAMQFLP